MADSHDPTETRSDAPPPVLGYGRQRARRWRQWVMPAGIVILVVTGAALIYPRVSTWLEMRAGIRGVNAWYQQARTCRIPSGTLLYSENPADFPPRKQQTATGNGRSRTFVTFTDNYPLLRMVGYSPDNVPSLYEFDVLFVHEQRMWEVPSGTKPYVVSISYMGTDIRGRPTFQSAAFDIGKGKPPFPSMGGGGTVEQVPDRPVTNLRIYAGSADPKDGTRFSLPFQCDGGSGRFEFRMDDDVRDGGRIGPEVWIVWDPPPSATAAGAKP